MGAERLEELLKEAMALALRERHGAEGDLRRVNVDTTVQEKIGPLQSDHRVDRCFGAGLVGDAIHAVPAAAGSNLPKLLRRLAAALIVAD